MDTSGHKESIEVMVMRQPCDIHVMFFQEEKPVFVEEESKEDPMDTSGHKESVKVLVMCQLRDSYAMFCQEDEYSMVRLNIARNVMEQIASLETVCNLSFIPHYSFSSSLYSSSLPLSLPPFFSPSLSLPSSLLFCPSA